MKTSRNKLKSKRIWSEAIFNRLRIKCTYKQSNEIIDRMHKEFFNFILNKHRPVRIPNVGTLYFKKFKPLNKIYILKEGSRKMTVSHHTQGYCYRYVLKFNTFDKVKPYRFSTCRKENRELSKKIFNRELQLP